MRNYASKEAARIEREQNRQRHRDLSNDPMYKIRNLERANLNKSKVQAWLNQYKLERGCIDCMFKEHAVALELDHMGDKVVCVSRCGSIQAAFDEIQDGKCVVRCCNCHRLKTWCDKSNIDYVVDSVPLLFPESKINRFKADFKIKHGCAKCRYNKHFAPLDFHHVGDKGMDVGSIRTVERFILELAWFPCEILCANCHQIHHAEGRS